MSAHLGVGQDHGADVAAFHHHARETLLAGELHLRALVFEEEGAIDKFEGFASEHGPRFYGLPLNEGTVTLERSGTQVPELIDGNGTPIVPFHAGEELAWRYLG